MYAPVGAFVHGLAVCIACQVQTSCTGVSFTVSPGKATKWLTVIEQAIEQQHLASGCAQKLAWRLTWATQHLFRKLGRAMIKPLFAQCSTTSGSAGPRLLVALEWWAEILHYDITECKAWVEPVQKSCHLFVDAASTPPRCAAVLIMDGGTWYTDVEPPEAIMKSFMKRRDKQIMTLEILAIMLAISTFADKVKDRKVILYSDNTGTTFDYTMQCVPFVIAFIDQVLSIPRREVQPKLSTRTRSYMKSGHLPSS